MSLWEHIATTIIFMLLLIGLPIAKLIEIFIYDNKAYKVEIFGISIIVTILIMIITIICIVLI